jgi:hypothetical protein
MSDSSFEQPREGDHPKSTRVPGSDLELAARKANFPATYEAARRALEECVKIDECKSWSNRAVALATYAKMARDKGLLRLTKQVYALAARRMGELLAEIEPNPGGQPAHSTKTAIVPSRKQAATDAGLSERQAKTVLRVANVPEEEFKRQVESENPPSVTALAAQGTVHRGPVANDDSARLMRLVDRLLEALSQIEITPAIAGIPQKERARFLENAEQCARILNAIVVRTRMLGEQRESRVGNPNDRSFSGARGASC